LIALVFTPLVSPGVPVLAAAMVSIIVGWATSRRIT
jgi:hypothetical protein